MPGGVFEAGLVAESIATGKERRSRGPVEGAPQREGAGVVSPGGGDTQDGRRAVDSGGGAYVGGISGNCNVTFGNRGALKPTQICLLAPVGLLQACNRLSCKP